MTDDVWGRLCYFIKKLFNFHAVAAQGLRCWVRAFSSSGEREPLSSCGAWALHRGGLCSAVAARRAAGFSAQWAFQCSGLFSAAAARLRLAGFRRCSS